MNTDLIYTIIRYSMLAIDFIIVLCALGYLGFGFLWGFRKNLRRMLSFIVPFLLFVCFINLIAKLFMNADISFILQRSEPLSVKGFAIQLISQYLYNNDMDLATNSKIIELAEAIAVAGIKLVVYLIGLIVIAFIVAPLLRFCAWVTYRVHISKKEEKPRVHIVSRAIGMGIGSIRFVIFAFLIIIPLFGFISTANLALEDVLAVSQMIEIETSQPETENGEMANQYIDMNILEILNTVDSALDKSLAKKVMNATANKKTGITFDSYYLGEMIKVRTSDANINIITEYGNVRQAIPVVDKVLDLSYNNGTFGYDFDYKVLTDDDVDTIVSIFQNFQSMDVILPIGLEYGCYYLETNKIDEKYDLDIEAIKSIDINNDFNLLFDSIGIVSKTFIKLDIDWENPQNVLTNSELPKTIESFMKTILKTDTINKVALPYGINKAKEIIVKQNIPEINELVELLTAENVKLCLENDISAIFNIAQEAYGTSFKEYIDKAIKGEQIEFNVDFSDPTIQKLLSDTVSRVMDLKVIEGHENTLIETIFKLTYKGDFDIETILYDENGVSKIDWSTEPEILAAALVQSLVMFNDVISTDDIDYNEIIDIIINNPEKTDELVNLIATSDIFRLAVVNLIPDFLEKQEGIPVELKEIFNEETFKQLETETVFVEQIELIVSVARDLYDLGITDYENFKFDSTKVEEYKLIVNKALDCIFIKDKEEQLIKLLMDKTSLGSMLSEYGITLEYDNVTDWSTEISTIVDIAFDVIALVGDGDFKIDNLFISDNPDQQIDKLTTLFENIVSSKLLKPIIFQMIEKVASSIVFTEEDKASIDWSTEPRVLATALVKAYAMFDDFIKSETKDPKELINIIINDSTKTNELVDIIATSDIARLAVVKMVPHFMNSQSGIPTEIKDLFDEETFKQLENKVVFKEQIQLIVSIVRDLYDLGLTDFNNFKLDPTKSELLKSAANKVLDCILISGKEERIFKLLVEKTNLNSMLTSYDITLDYSKVTNWSNEVSVMVDILVDFMNIAGDGEFNFDQLFASDASEEQINKVADLFENIASSELFKPIIFQMIEKVGYDITFTESDKAKIEENTWGVEIKALLQLKGEAQSLLEVDDLSSVSGTQVEQLMLKASESVIATKIVGTILSKYLGPDGLNINPVDTEGKPLYDFTDQTVMHDQAANIGNLIDLANSVRSFNLDTLEGIDDVTEAIANLDSNDLAKSFVSEIVGDAVDLDEINFTENADVVKEVYDAYASAPDKENFEIDPESQLAEDLQNAGLAEAILKALGIL